MVTFLRNIAFNRKFAVKCMMLFCLLFTISTIQVSNVTMHAEAKGGWVENDEKLYGDDEDAKK